MIRYWLHLTLGAAAIGFGVSALSAADSKRSPSARPLSSASGDAKAGADLRQRLLGQQPVATSINGLLKLRDAEGNRREIPVRIQTKLRADGGWESVYETLVEPSEQLTVLRDGAEAKHFLLSLRRGATNELGVSEVFHKFAGTDFSAADLGLYFLHWPVQVELTRQLRRNRACQVLESSTPSSVSGGYARVRSWVDIETGGIIHADAYDAEGKQVKEFSLRSFKKVDGRWQLQEMEIIDLRSDSRTRLEFDLTLDAPAAGR